MSKEIVSADEMSFLLNKNRELVMQELLNEKTLPTVHFAIEKGLMALNETLENITKKELNTLLVDYQLQNGEAFLSQKMVDSLVVFNYSVSHNHGKQFVLIQQQELEVLYAYLKEIELDTDLSDPDLDWLFKQITLSFKNYYKRFTEDLNCHIHLDPAHISKLNVQSDSLVDAKLDELYEIKVYELQFNEHRVHLVHLSNLDFLEYAYENLESEEEQDIYFDELYGTTEDEMFNTSPSYSKEVPLPSVLSLNKEIKKPQFAAFNEQDYDNGKHNLGLLHDVPLELSVVLGKTKRSVKEVLEINTGKIIELNKYADDPLEIYVNGKLIAEGEVVVVDENFGVRVTKLFSNELNFKTNKR